MEGIVQIEKRHVSFDAYAGEVHAVRGVSLEVHKGEVLAIVGESGCGKSVTAQTIMKLNPMPPARIKEGSITLCGKDIVAASEKEMQGIRGQMVSMIFQDPMTCMNPTMRVGKQLTETLVKKGKISRKDAEKEAVRLLKMVQIPNAEERAKQYPHEFSGGMRQRAMIAMALACNPQLLIADEPTTALDVTIQAQVLELMKKLKQEYRETALDPKQFRKLGSNEWIDISALDETNPEVYETIYYKEVPIESKKLSETMIVTYSPKYRAYQKKIREQQLERAKKLIESGDKLKKERRNPNDPARFVKKTSVTEYGEVADKEIYELDKDMIDKETMYDGFYAVVTDIEGDAAQIININKRRWQIEECFRIMKTEFDARPVYLRREDRIKAHFLICFIALMIFRLLEIRLEKEYTAEQIISTLKKMEVCRLEEYGYIPTYTRTELTDKLHEVFGFRTDTEIIRKSKMRSIIKKSKEKQ